MRKNESQQEKTAYDLASKAAKVWEQSQQLIDSTVVTVKQSQKLVERSRKLRQSSLNNQGILKQ
jgi:hypothetical protein